MMKKCFLSVLLAASLSITGITPAFMAEADAAWAYASETVTAESGSGELNEGDNKPDLSEPVEEEERVIQGDSFAPAIGETSVDEEVGPQTGKVVQGPLATRTKAAVTVLDSPGEGIVPYPVNNLSGYDYWNTTGDNNVSGMAATDEGFVRVYFDSDNSKIYVERLTDDLMMISRKTLDKELDYYGGFYATKDAYYLVFGKKNVEEDTNAEVVRLVKYDKNWKRISQASIKGDSEFAHEVSSPMHAAGVSMTECGGTLYIAMGHVGYVDQSIGQGHQGLLLMAVDLATMKGRIADADLWHSFGQRLAAKDGNTVFLAEESEGSRASVISKMTPGDEENAEKFALLGYGGSRTSVWSIPTCASVEDIAVSAKNVMTLGTSIDQTKWGDDFYGAVYNVYLTVTPTDNFTKEASTFKWVTDYDEQNTCTCLALTKINDNRFMISWRTIMDEESIAGDEVDQLSKYVMHYVFVDGNGNAVTKEFKAPAAASNCHPVVKNGKAVFYSAKPGQVQFCAIDAATGAMTKRTYKVAGPKAFWDYKDGVLTVFGSGSLYPDLITSAFDSIRLTATKVWIKPGITSIPKESFIFMDSLKTVMIAKTVKTIGDRAFGYNGAMTKIYIPESVTSIGDDITGAGYFWYGSGSFTDAVIYCKSGSPIHKYAEENGIKTKLASLTLGDQTKVYTGEPVAVGGAKKSVIYGGIVYTCYLDQKCTIKTSADNGAVKEGGAPSLPGRYWVKATSKEDPYFYPMETEAARLTVVPAGTTITKLTPGSKQFTVKWTKQPVQTTGFQIQYATDKDFTKNKKTFVLKGADKCGKTITGLKAKTKYWVRIRAYRTLSNTTVYSSWSNVKATTLK